MPGWYQAYGHAERVFDVSFSPVDDALLASASEDTTVRLWRQDQNHGIMKQVLCCFGHAAEVMRVGWSSNGQLLLSGSADATVRIWQAPTDDMPSYSGKQVGLLEGHPEEVYHCQFISLTGLQEHASNTSPAMIRSHGTTTGSSSSSVCGGAGSDVPAHGRNDNADEGSSDGGGGVSSDDIGGVCVGSSSSEESHILVASSESLFVWDIETCKMVHKADAPGTSGSTVPPEAVTDGYKHAYIFGCCKQRLGPLVITACCDGLVRLWSLGHDGQLVYQKQLDLQVGMLTSCTLNIAETEVACTSRSGKVVLVDLHHFVVRQQFSMPCGSLACCCVRQGDKDQLLLTCTDGNMRMYDWQEPGLDPAVFAPPQPYQAPLLAVATNASHTAWAVAGEASDMPPLLTPKQPASASGSGTAAAALKLQGRRGKGRINRNAAAQPAAFAAFSAADSLERLALEPEQPQIHYMEATEEVAARNDSHDSAARNGNNGDNTVPGSSHAGAAPVSAPLAGMTSRAPIFVWRPYPGGQLPAAGS